MANSQSHRPMTVPGFVSAKQQGRKLTVLTAYDCLFARLFDDAGVDAILVGDSLGMVVQGRDTTLPVTLDQIIYHAEIVARSVWPGALGVGSALAAVALLQLALVMRCVL